MSDPIVIRPSSTPKWDDCALRSAGKAYPELFQQAGYQLREIPSHIGAVVGTSVHAGGERLLRSKLEGKSASFTEAAEAAEESLEYQLTSSAIHYDNLTPQQGTAARQIRRMVQRYSIDVADSSQPIAVEQRMKAQLKSGTILSGQMDSICILPDAIRDTKTGRMRSWNTPQYGAYSAIARANGYRDVEKILEDFIPRVSLKDDQPETQTVEIDRRHAERVASKIVTRIEKQVQEFVATRDVLAFPANPSSSLCKDTFCPFHGTATCKEWRRE